MFKKDTVWFSGQFKGTTFFRKNKCIIKFITPIPSIYANSYGIDINVNADGTFKTAIPVLGPVWTEMFVTTKETHLISKYIPAMLHPGDHLSLTVEDYDSEEPTFNWKSNHQYHAQFVDLIDIFPARYPIYKALKNPSLDSLQQTVKVSEQAAAYLSEKYKLSKTERALLLTQANLSKICEALRTIDQYVVTSQINYKKNLKTLGYTPDVRDTMQQYSNNVNYKIISMLRADNKAFMIVPAIESLTRDLSTSPHFHSIGYQEDWFLMPNDYSYLYWSDVALHKIRMQRNKPLGSDRLFEQWFKIAINVPFRDLEHPLPNINEINKLNTEAVTLPIFQAWKKAMLTE